jgi:hypothetical protein
MVNLHATGLAGGGGCYGDGGKEIKEKERESRDERIGQVERVRPSERKTKGKKEVEGCNARIHTPSSKYLPSILSHTFTRACIHTHTRSLSLSLFVFSHVSLGVCALRPKNDK